MFLSLILQTNKKHPRLLYIPAASNDRSDAIETFKNYFEKLGAIVDILYIKDMKYAKEKFMENDIILAKITPCMENGKCGIASGLTNGIGMGSSEFHILRCSDKINNKYLFTYLNRNTIRKEAEQNMTGASGHRRVPITFYENLDIPLPTMNKQKEIVAEIESYEKIILDTQIQINTLKNEKRNILEKYLK